MNVLLNRDKTVEARMLRGLSQEEVAGKVGCSPRTYQRAEGSRQITVMNAHRIAEVLEVPLAALLQDTGDDDPVVTAFLAADDAIQRELGRIGEYGTREVVAVLSLLLVRFGSGIAREIDDVDFAVAAIDSAVSAAKRAIPEHV